MEYKPPNFGPEHGSLLFRDYLPESPPPHIGFPVDSFRNGAECVTVCQRFINNDTSSVLIIGPNIKPNTSFVYQNSRHEVVLMVIVHKIGKNAFMGKLVQRPGAFSLLW